MSPSYSEIRNEALAMTPGKLIQFQRALMAQIQQELCSSGKINPDLTAENPSPRDQKTMALLSNLSLGEQLDLQVDLACHLRLIATDKNAPSPLPPRKESLPNPFRPTDKED